MLVHMIKRMYTVYTLSLSLSLISKNAMYLNSKLRFHFHEVFALYFGYCFMPFSFIHFRFSSERFYRSFFLSFFRFLV